MASVRLVPATPNLEEYFAPTRKDEEDAAATDIVLVWTGWGDSKPTMRRGGVAAIAAASRSATEQCAHAYVSIARASARCKFRMLHASRTLLFKHSNDGRIFPQRLLRRGAS